jgi:hypothetical protein
LEKSNLSYVTLQSVPTVPFVLEATKDHNNKMIEDYAKKARTKEGLVTNNAFSCVTIHISFPL